MQLVEAINDYWCERAQHVSYDIYCTWVAKETWMYCLSDQLSPQWGWFKSENAQNYKENEKQRSEKIGEDGAFLSHILEFELCLPNF